MLIPIIVLFIGFSVWGLLYAYRGEVDLWLMNNDWYVNRVALSTFFSYCVQNPETYGFRFWIKYNFGSDDEETP